MGVKPGGLNAIGGEEKEWLGRRADKAFQGDVQLAVESTNHLKREISLLRQDFRHTSSPTQYRL